MRTIGTRAFAMVLLAACTLGRPPIARASPWSNLADPLFLRVDTRELPSGSINAVAQDAAGFIWVGTQDGLARFDGYRFKSFAPDPNDAKALPDGDVLAMAADAAGGLWLGTKSSGLVRFDIASETFRTWRRDRAGRNGPRSASVNAVAVAADGAVWIGGDGGLDRYDRRTGVFQTMDLARGAHQPVVWAILIDRAGTVWAGTEHGLFGGTARRGFAATRLGTAGGGSPIVWSLYEDAAGRLWAGSDNVLFALERGGRVAALRSSPSNPATLGPGSQFSIIEPTPGTVWVGTNEDGLSIVDTASGRVRRVAPDPTNPGGLKAGELWQMFRDRSGLIWLAKNAGGLLAFNPLAKGFYALSASRPELGLSGQGAGSVLASGANLWVGGSHGSLVELNPRAARATKIDVPSRGFVSSLVAGSGGTIWVGTVQGLCRLQPGATTAQCPAGPSQLRNTTVWQGLYAGGALWAGTREGLVVQNESSGKVTVYRQGDGPNALSNDEVRAVYRDRSGRVWAGTADGLNRIDPVTHRVRRFTFDPHDPNTIGPGLIWSILEDRRGRIWAGTVGGPLDVVRAGANGVRVRRLDRADGLPDENVYGLAEDPRGRVWASTENGVAYFDPGSMRARALGIADGVLDEYYWGSSVSRADDGTMFFGGFHGVMAIAPDAESPWSYSPPLVLSTLKLGRRSVPVAGPNRGESVALPAGDRAVAAEFASLDYSAPQRLRYAYKLDGFDRDWIETDALHRTATYTNLPPGTYTLRVRGTNRLGAWSASELALRIVALPAWYETWWFRALLALLAIALVLWAMQWRTAVLRRRQHELQTIVDQRTNELSAANLALRDANVALSAANIALAEASLSDPLTGLRNRRFLMHHIGDDVTLALRRYDDRPAARSAETPHDADLLFFMVDVDHFKTVNDELGHAAGDRLLMQMRERLEQVFRTTDYVVRWGGEEFLAVARGSSRADAADIAERLREAVASRPFSLDGGQLIAKTASIGFAAFPFVPSKPHAVEWQHVVELADQALYMAKRAGRNTWFGLAASERTDAELLARLAVTSAEEAARECALVVVGRTETSRSPS
jgi:diguanylate cyclase (GGDEF)-like protein